MAATHTDLDIEDYGALAQFLIELKDLIRSEPAEAYDSLRVIDTAIDIAIEDNPHAAIEFVHDVVLGRIFRPAARHATAPAPPRRDDPHPNHETP
jgi:hypothetical protein